jgi:sulfofructose kinase
LADPFLVDVLCVGHACYDLVFLVDHHPGPDEKSRADAFLNCGGGTAANAAMTAARLGHRAAFSGYLGTDIYGEQHLSELREAGVNTSMVIHGTELTPLSAIFVKPDGQRSIVNYKGDTNRITPADVDLTRCSPKVVLLDGHQPALALHLAEYARQKRIPVVLDADTINAGNEKLVYTADYVVASERFAREITGEGDEKIAMARLVDMAPSVVVTMGERGLIWQDRQGRGSLPAYSVDVVDTTGAGDAFHGAFAAGVSAGMAWDVLLRYASAAAALCCMRQGARPGIPTGAEVREFLATSPALHQD